MDENEKCTEMIKIVLMCASCLRARMKGCGI